MPIGVSQFQILSPEQANPFGHGFEQGSDIISKILRTRLAQQEGQRRQEEHPQEMLKHQLINSILQQQEPYAGEEAQLGIEQKQLANEASRQQNPWLGKQAEQNLQQTQLGNQLRQLNLENYPEQKRLEMDKLRREAASPFGGQHLSGTAAERLGIELLRQQYGEESPVYKDALKTYNANVANQESITNARNQYAESANKRVSTTLGKLYSELEEINNGFLPGSNETIKLSPEQQQQMEGQWNLKIIKDITDAGVRQKNILVKNIDKTLDSVNIDDVVKYSGLAGPALQKIGQGKSLVGKEKEDYKKFEESLTSLDLLAKQIRQFYGESIQPQVMEKIENLVNPISWATSPDIAKAKYEQLVSVLKSETESYREAVKSADVYSGTKKSTSSDSDPLGIL